MGCEGRGFGGGVGVEGEKSDEVEADKLDSGLGEAGDSGGERWALHGLAVGEVLLRRVGHLF